MFSAFAQIPSFRVMEILAQAQALEDTGKTILHLEAGQPRRPLPTPIQELIAEIVSEPVGYTPSRGSVALRQALHTWYVRQSVNVSADNIAVASGSSPLLWAWLSLLLRPGDEVLVLDPGYPAYSHLSRALGAVVVPLPSSAACGYSLDIAQIRRHLTRRTRLLLLGSPANPTGSTIPVPVLQEAAQLVPYILVDEIYRGLQLSGAPVDSILSAPPENCIVVDGFAKRYAMPGWRLGYTVAPRTLIDRLDPLLQNGLICANPVSQAVGQAILQPEYDALPRQAAADYQENLQTILPAMLAAGWQVDHLPEAAFYLLASHPGWQDGQELAQKLLHGAGIAVTPGADFGRSIQHTIRLSLCSDLETAKKAAKIVGELSL